MAESKEGLKNPSIRVKEKSEKASLKLNIKKPRIMASGPITSRKIEREKVEAVTDFLFLGSKITVDGDYNHELRRQLLLGRQESYDKPRQCAEKQRHHSANKGPYHQAMFFPVVMYGCESWIIKRAESQRIDAFEL